MLIMYALQDYKSKKSEEESGFSIIAHFVASVFVLLQLLSMSFKTKFFPANTVQHTMDSHAESSRIRIVKQRVAVWKLLFPFPHPFPHRDAV
jgi:hypothetical protein